MRLRCSAASQRDCIKTMARLLRRNKGGWQQNPKQTAQMQWRGHQGSHLSLRCDVDLHQDTSQTAQIQRMCAQDPNQPLGCAVGGCIETQAWLPRALRSKREVVSRPKPGRGVIRTRARLLRCTGWLHEDPSMADRSAHMQQVVETGRKSDWSDANRGGITSPARLLRCNGGVASVPNPRCSDAAGDVHQQPCLAAQMHQ